MSWQKYKKTANVAAYWHNFCTFAPIFKDTRFYGHQIF